MKPGGGGKPSGELLKLIERDFGSFEKFVDQFKLAASHNLVQDGHGLHVSKLPFPPYTHFWSLI